MGKDMPAWKQAAREKFLNIYYNFKDETKKTDEKIADEIIRILQNVLKRKRYE